MLKKFVGISLVLLALPFFGYANYGNLNETIGVGKTVSVGLNTLTNGSWFISGNPNPAVIQASISSSSLIIQGIGMGASSVSACATDNSGCVNVNVTVNGLVLGSFTGAHLAGSWVLGSDGRTVYYVLDNGLIPITTWEIFLDNGGTSEKIVKINQYDEQLPLLAFMTNNDSRVE
jgi:hypothetical protein